MITNLSFSPGNSANSFVDLDSCSVNYSTFNLAISLTASMGQGALLAKMYILSTFHLSAVPFLNEFMVVCHFLAFFSKKMHFISIRNVKVLVGVVLFLV